MEAPQNTIEILPITRRNLAQFMDQYRNNIILVHMTIDNI